jgi:peptide/nickel transport system permease protein
VLFSVALTFLGLTCVTFIIGRIIPIDPVLAIVGDKASNETYARVRAEIGLDLPVPVQYWRYLMKILHGDFGNSVITSHPVLEDLLRVFPATLELAFLALAIGVVVGVPLGVVAATHRGRWQDQVVRFASLLGYSMPVFWLGLVGLLLFYAKLGWVEGPGRIDVSFDDIVPTITGLITVDSLLAGEYEVFWNAFWHLLLPASILGYLSLAYVARMTRSFMLSQLNQEYVLATLAKGLSPFRVVWVHALGNVWVQLVTVIALTFGSLLEGAVLTETVFAWPGLGLYMKNSLFNADLNAVLGGTVLVGVVYIGLNMLSDLVYPLVDPRARDRA